MIYKNVTMTFLHFGAKSAKTEFLGWRSITRAVINRFTRNKRHWKGNSNAQENVSQIFYKPPQKNFIAIFHFFKI